MASNVRAAQLVLLRTVYSQAQGCVSAALQLGGDVERPWIMRNLARRQSVS